MDRTDKPATGEYGSFLVAVENLPADFKVVARNGNQGDQVFPVDLEADYRGFDATSGIVHVNMVTTLVSTYLDKHPDRSLDEATAIVKGFLEIPEWVDIGSGLRASAECFGHRQFMVEAAQNGGVSQYIDQLISEMDSGGPGATHPFPGEAPNIAAGALGAFVGKSLAKGALSYAGGELLGWGLGQMGLGFGDESAGAIAAMQKQLAQISLQLEEINNKLSQIYNALSLQINQTNYDVRVGQMTTLISNIKSISQKLANFVSNPPADESLLRTKRQDIIDLIKDRLVGNETVIHDQLVGIGLQTPLLKIWSQIVKSKHRFLSAKDHEDITAQFDYFDMLQAWQAELLVEYYHAIGEGEDYHEGIDDAIDGYARHREEQLELLLPPLPEGTYLASNSGLMVMCGGDVSMHYAYFITWYHENLNRGAPNPADCFGHKCDWRLPTEGEVVALFDGWKGNVSQRARDEGWDDIVADMRIATSTLLHIVVPVPPYNWHQFQYLNTTTGKWGHGEIIGGDCSPWCHTVAVRTPAADERYFW